MNPVEATRATADLEVWPDTCFLLWKDQSGQLHKLTRRKDQAVVNVDDPQLGPTTFDLDCFGQGEAQQVSLRAQEDPQALQRYLDRFVGVQEALDGENKVRDELLRLQTEIEQAEQQVNQIPVYERLLTTAKQQLAALKKPDVKELIELQQHLSQERTLRKQIAENLATAKKDVGALASRKAAKKIRSLADPKILTVGKLEYQSIAKNAGELETSLTAIEASIKSNIETFDSTVVADFAEWQLKETAAQERVDKKRRELEALNVTFDMSYIAKLAQDEATHQQSVTNLKAWKPHLLGLQVQRNQMLLARWSARNRVAMLRSAFALKASGTLRDSLSDLNVSLKYTANALSPEGAELMITAMGWRTNQQPRAAWLVQELTIPVLLEAIKAKDKKPILQIKTPEGVPVFKSGEAAEILERLGAPTVKYALERVAVHDLPKLQITKEVVDSKGAKKYVTKEFAKLSLGQQQSVLLALMLSAESNRPLIIDQPEDNLDGEFIYATLVPILRRAKERRQVIVVTHNANVAVLGDAEQVIVMKAGSEKGEVSTRGSIDHPVTRDAACGILEGAKEAFVKRARIYGVL
jgi:ABC-type Fe3+/spermidine/putrescine transport system ATPase subunit